MTAGDPEAALANLSKSLGVDPSDDVAKIEAEYFTGSLIAPAEWPALAKTLAQGSKTDIEQAHRFAGLAALPEAERVASYLQIFCTGEGTPRKSIVTKAIKDAALVERLYAGNRHASARCSTAAAPWPAATAARRCSPSPMRCWSAT